jgi:hypothetical protein
MNKLINLGVMKRPSGLNGLKVNVFKRAGIILIFSSHCEWKA